METKQKQSGCLHTLDFRLHPMAARCKGRAGCFHRRTCRLLRIHRYFQHPTSSTTTSVLVADALAAVAPDSVEILSVTMTAALRLERRIEKFDRKCQR